MRLLKFYGRTMDGALFRVKKELGDDALIVETKTIRPDSATARLHPGAKYEVTAAIETPAGQIPPIPVEPRNFGEWVKRNVRVTNASSHEEAQKPQKKGEFVPPIPLQEADVLWSAQSMRAPSSGKPCSSLETNSLPGARMAHLGKAGAWLAQRKAENSASRTVLEDLGRLKAQVRGLVEEVEGARGDVRNQADLADYRHLIDQGVESSILAQSFRRWLDWRMGTPGCGAEFLPLFNPSEIMRGQGLREWLWHEWRHQLACFRELKSGSSAPVNGPEIMGFVGGSGVGKTTVLAKMASKRRLKDGKRAAILTLDRQPFGSNDTWKRLSKVMDVALLESVTPENISDCMERMSRFDWIGVDTPSGMTSDSGAGRVYGSLLARLPNLRTSLVADATSRDRANREQMNKMQFTRPDHLIFSKLDEAPQRGGMINLTLEKPWLFELASTGRRVPEDLENATPEALWRWVFASDANEPAPSVLEGASR